MQFTDAVAVAGTRRLADGYLVAEAKCVRTGIQLYSGAEVGKPDMPVVRVYRDAAEVFADASLQSFSHAPITMDHPAEPVTAESWKDLARGEVSTAAKKDGDWVMLPLILKDAAAIQSVIDGKRELSAGYTCELEFTPGVTADGAAYDAVQKNIKINHLALVDRARAGSQARIGDGATSWGVSPVIQDQGGLDMPDIKTKTVLVDGLSVETTDAGAQAIEKLQGIIVTLTADKAKLEAKIATDAAAHTEALTKKDAEIATAKASIITGDKLDAAIQSRGKLIGDAKRLAGDDFKTDGLSDADIRKGAVTKKLGDEACKGKDTAFFDHGFDLLVAQLPAADSKTTVDPLAAALRDAKPHVNTTDADKARQEAETAQANAWKTKAA
jgi:hypothetical protein